MPAGDANDLPASITDTLLYPLDDSRYPGTPIRFRRFHNPQLQLLPRDPTSLMNWSERSELRVLRDYMRKQGAEESAAGIDAKLK